MKADVRKKEEGTDVRNVRKKEEGRRKNYLYFSLFLFSCFSLSFFSSASEAEPLDIDSRAEPGS
jgi:hypothetical protein